MEILFTLAQPGIGTGHSPVDGTGSGGADEPSDSYSVEDLLSLVQQQQSAITSFLGSVGQPSAPGAGGFMGAFESGGLPDFSDPTGDAIDFLLGSTGSGGGAGDVFTLALSASGRGLELAQVPGAVAAWAQSAYQDAEALVQLVEDARQSNFDTLFQTGRGGGPAGFSALI